MSHIKYFVI